MGLISDIVGVGDYFNRKQHQDFEDLQQKALLKLKQAQDARDAQKQQADIANQQANQGFEGRRVNLAESAAKRQEEDSTPQNMLRNRLIQGADQHPELLSATGPVSSQVSQQVMPQNTSGFNFNFTSPTSEVSAEPNFDTMAGRLPGLAQTHADALNAQKLAAEKARITGEGSETRKNTAMNNATTIKVAQMHLDAAKAKGDPRAAQQQALLESSEQQRQNLHNKWDDLMYAYQQNPTGGKPALEAGIRAILGSTSMASKNPNADIDAVFGEKNANVNVAGMFGMRDRIGGLLEGGKLSELQKYGHDLIEERAGQNAMRNKILLNQTVANHLGSGSEQVPE